MVLFRYHFRPEQVPAAEKSHNDHDISLMVGLYMVYINDSGKM